MVEKISSELGLSWCKMAVVRMLSADHCSMNNGFSPIELEPEKILLLRR